MQMLKPGGQFFFLIFSKTYLDDTFDRLDDGKWIKYNHRSSISPFYKCKDPLNEYKAVMEEVGFVDYQLFEEPYTTPIPEKSFESRYFSLFSKRKFL